MLNARSALMETIQMIIWSSFVPCAIFLSTRDAWGSRRFLLIIGYAKCALRLGRRESMFLVHCAKWKEEPSKELQFILVIHFLKTRIQAFINFPRNVQISSIKKNISVGESEKMKPTMIISQNLATPLINQSVTLSGFTMFVQFGCQSVISRRKMLQSISKESRILTKRGLKKSV